MKRHQADKEVRRRASKDFYANEVCWGLTIALNLGLDAKECMKMLADDFDKWGNHVDWENYD